MKHTGVHTISSRQDVQQVGGGGVVRVVVGKAGYELLEARPGLVDRTV